MPRPKRSTRRKVKATTDPVVGLAGSLAHDFSNLLLVIRSAAGFIKDDLAPDDPQQGRLSQLLDAADRAARLTQQLQAIGRSQLLAPELLAPGKAVRALSEALRHVVPDDVGLRIVVRAADTLVWFDASQLPVVLMNLLSYAGERVSSHGRLLLVVEELALGEAEAAKQTIPPGRYVSIAVASTGQHGLELENVRAFEPHLAGKKLPHGTDLRLASVFGIVTQSGGFVTTGSRPGRGFDLTVLLPVAAPEDARKVVKVERTRSRDLTGDELILLVEDDLQVRGVVREALERYGYTVMVAADGGEASRLMQLLSAPPNLLLTDLVMPEVTGRELIEGLRLEGQLPKVLMMSGYADDDVLRRARPSDVLPFIRKPFTHEQLAAKVRQVLDE